MKLTDEQRDHLRHALGRDRSSGSYRNHFVTDIDGPDAQSWRGRVAAGLATETFFPHAPNSVLFRVTDAGRAALGEMS